MNSLFFQIQNQIRSHLDSHFTNWVKNESGWNREVAEAALYSFVGAGKCLRPSWVLWSYYKSQKSIQNFDIHQIPSHVWNCALAVEMIHTYSLIHDDLPSMDNDDWRRGKPTSHKKFGEAIAVLTGDALLTGAFEILTRSRFSNYGNQLTAIQKLATASGASGIIGGQVRDISNSDQNFAELSITHKQKTGALFAASLELGALCNEQLLSKDTLLALEKLGLEFGYSFQLSDDLLDLKGNSKLMGKTAKIETIKLKAPMLVDQNALSKELSKSTQEMNNQIGQAFPFQSAKDIELEFEQILEYLFSRVH